MIDTECMTVRTNIESVGSLVSSCHCSLEQIEYRSVCAIFERIYQSCVATNLMSITH